jgi:hypothetical protein
MKGTKDIFSAKYDAGSKVELQNEESTRYL